MLIHILYASIIILWGMSINFSNKIAKKRYIFVVSAILILVSGLRNMYIGPDDTYNYYNTFINISRSSYLDLLGETKDPLFGVFTKVLQIFIGNHFQLYLLICSAILIVPLGRFIYRESNNPMLSFLMFVSLGFYYFSMVCIRQSMAIGVLLLSYDALKQHRLLPFVICVLVAAMFHLSALVFILIYPLSYFKYNYISLIAYVIAVVITLTIGQSLVGSFDLSLIDERFGGYQVGESRVLSAAGIIQLAIFAIFFMFYYKKMKRSIPETTSLHSHFLSLAFIFQGLVFVIAEFFRVSWYFKVYLLVLIPLILSFSGKQRKLYTIIFCLLFIAYFFINEGYVDYAFYWQHYVPKF